VLGLRSLIGLFAEEEVEAFETIHVLYSLEQNCFFIFILSPPVVVSALQYCSCFMCFEEAYLICNSF
jgi:hypothetical protein